jgi:hypothetical protein
MSRRRLHEEHGAAATLVAVMLIVLVGMAALVIDDGWLFISRRRIVQAADAAALAAALSCANKEGVTTASSQALTYGTGNDPDAAMVGGYPQYDPNCDAEGGTVTVRLTAEKEQFFAPALGRSETGTVAFTATASWGAIGSGVGNVVPFMVNNDHLTNTCGIPDAAPGTVCYFYMNNNQVGDSNWAPLNMITDPSHPSWGWDVPPTRSCNVDFVDSANEPLKTWIREGVSWNVWVNFPDPTYVCRIPGQRHDLWPIILERMGEELLFPVNNPAGQLDQLGNPAPPPNHPFKYDIQGFTILKVINLVRGNEGGRNWDPNCPGPVDANAWCLKAEWVGYTTEPGGTGGDDFGVVAVSLDA